MSRPEPPPPGVFDDATVGASTYPAWFVWTFVASAAAATVSLLVAVILLTTPEANRFFRPAQTYRPNGPSAPV
jgi:hypothetical protein